MTILELRAKVAWCPLTSLSQELLLKGYFQAQDPFPEGLADEQCGILLSPSLSVISFIWYLPANLGWGDTDSS